MATINKKTDPTHTTHEGGVAKRINPEQQLRRSVMACMLWEDTFYDDGIEIAKRLEEEIGAVHPLLVTQIAWEAREKMKLRHVPLLIARIMSRLPSHKHLVAQTLERAIQRADELTEFMAIYWKDKREKVSAQVKKGLARAFPKFSAYDLAKYNRDGKVKLRDVLFICHAKPKDAEQAEVWKKLIEGTLPSPDTWEVELSAGKYKKATWERLIVEKKLGALALLRNLRNMEEVKVEREIIREALREIKTDRVLPFRFISAARYAPRWEPELEEGMFKALASKEKMKGKTVILIDVSGSMEDALSHKSEVTKMDAASGLAILLREICEGVSVYTFSNDLVLVPSRRGFALRDVINNSQPHRSTYLGNALEKLSESYYDRIIVVTDEQAHDTVPGPKGKGYLINVAPYKNGVGYGKWIHIDGFSEAVVDYIQVFEKEKLCSDG